MLNNTTNRKKLISITEFESNINKNSKEHKAKSKRVSLFKEEEDNNNENDKINKLSKALSKNSAHKESDILFATDFISNIKILKDAFINNKLNEIDKMDIILSLTHNFKYIDFSKNKEIISFNSLNDNFYVILKGEVSQYYLSKSTVNITAESYYSYIKLLLNNLEISLLKNIILSNIKTITLDELKKALIKNDQNKINSTPSALIKKNMDYIETLITNKTKLTKLSSILSYNNITINKKHNQSINKEKQSAQDYVNEFLIDYYKTLSISLKTVQENKEKIKFNEYLKTIAYTSTDQSDDILSINLYFYEFSGYLNRESTFGDLSLSSKNQISMQAFITNEDTICLTLNTMSYRLLLEDKLNPLLFKTINIILSGFLFKSIDIIQFKYKLFYAFSMINLRKDDVLINHKERNTYCYIVVEGSVSLSIKTTLKAMRNIVNNSKSLLLKDITYELNTGNNKLDKDNTEIIINHKIVTEGYIFGFHDTCYDKDLERHKNEVFSNHNNLESFSYLNYYNLNKKDSVFDDTSNMLFTVKCYSSRCKITKVSKEFLKNSQFKNQIYSNLINLIEEQSLKEFNLLESNLKTKLEIKHNTINLANNNLTINTKHEPVKTTNKYNNFNQCSLFNHALISDMNQNKITVEKKQTELKFKLRREKSKSKMFIYNVKLTPSHECLNIIDYNYDKFDLYDHFSNSKHNIIESFRDKVIQSNSKFLITQENEQNKICKRLYNSINFNTKIIGSIENSNTTSPQKVHYKSNSQNKININSQEITLEKESYFNSLKRTLENKINKYDKKSNSQSFPKKINLLTTDDIENLKQIKKRQLNKYRLNKF